MAFELSKSFAATNPIPSEEPVIIINFPVKSFLFEFKGPFAHFLIKNNINAKMTNNDNIKIAVIFFLINYKIFLMNKKIKNKLNIFINYYN